MPCVVCMMSGVLVVTGERLADCTEPAGLPWTRGGLGHSRERGQWHSRQMKEQYKRSVVALDNTRSVRGFLGTQINEVI